MSYDDDEYFYQLDAAMADFEEDVLKKTSAENTRSFLGSNGDAISERVESLGKAARFMLDEGYFAGSLISSVTGIELIIRYLLVLPLVQGALLPNEIAAVLTARIGSGRWADDRQLLPGLLKIYGIDLAALRLDSGDGLWPTFQNKVLEWRNLAVHQGDPCSKDEAITALACLDAFRTGLVSRIAEKLEFSLDRTGRWSHIEFGDSGDLSKSSGATIYTEKSPFKRPGSKTLKPKDGSKNRGAS